MKALDLRPEEKAAALIIAVGSGAAGKLLEYLSEDEVEALAAEIAKLERVEPQVLEQVIEEAKAEARTGLGALGGIDYLKKLLGGWHGTRGSEIIEGLSHDRDKVSFAFLRGLDPVAIARILEDEHPQTIALVLAHHPASVAARILTALDAETREAVAVRVARLGPVAPETIHRVEDALRNRLGMKSTAQMRESGGLRSLAQVLSNIEPEVERAIVEGIVRFDPGLAEEVRALMFLFEDILRLDDRTIQRVLADVSSDVLAIALKGAPDALTNAILRNMSQRARDRLTEEMDLLGPLPRKDVLEARDTIAKSVLTLADAGEITIKQGGGELIA